MTVFLSSEHFEHSKAAAANATRKAREKRAEAGEISATWDIEDHLTALDTRISPLKSIGTELMNAAIRAYHVLWPEATGPATVAELSKCLQTTETRLREWRSSSACAGADRALGFVLSWYEGIEIDTVRSLRTGSLWLSEPKLIESRKKAADYYADYAVTKYIIPGPVYEDGEEDDIEEDAGAEGDAAESSSEERYADSDEDADEDIEVEAPDANINAAAGTATTAATDDGLATATDTSVNPSAETAVKPTTEIASEAQVTYDDADA